MTVLAASELAPLELLRLFNACYSDYLVPLQHDERTFRAHLVSHDVDLECSKVLVDRDPAALALVARRGKAGWVAGVGTVPDRRRRGLSERALTTSLDAAAERGCSVVYLEVIYTNHAAIRLYEKLGFTVARDLHVWSLPPTCETPPSASLADVAPTQAWIAAHTQTRDPWQRSVATADAIRGQGGELRALMTELAGERAGVVWQELAGQAVVLQLAATGVAAATRALLATAGGSRGLRMINVEPGDPASQALEQLGARLLVTQHEMRIPLQAQRPGI